MRALSPAMDLPDRSRLTALVAVALAAAGLTSLACGTTVNPSETTSSAGAGGGASSSSSPTPTSPDPARLGEEIVLDTDAVPAGSAVAPDGSLYLGLNYGEDGHFLDHPLDAGAGSGIAIARLDPDGALVWLKSLPDAYGLQGIAIAPNGDLILCGGAGGGIDLGGGPLGLPAYQLVPFVARYTASGEHIWSTLYESPTFAASAAQCIADAEGRVFATGGSWSDFQKPALLAYSPGGELLWQQSTQSASPFWSSGLTVDHEGDVLLAAFLYSSQNIGFGWLAADPADALVAAYAPTGEPRWMLQLGGDLGDGAQALAATDFGVVAAGHEGGELVATDDDGIDTAGQAFAVLLDRDRSPQWAWVHETSGSSEAHALAPSALPGVWVAGDEILGDTRRGFVARVDADGAERTVLPIASVRHVVGVHRTDASHVLVVGDDRVAAPNAWDTQVKAIHIVIVDENGG
jgi:hypothetical protein